ncbi:MAG: hypothetical protein GY820_03155 [Gammaproteobacteria bacterium]|nr:hypothetical protein [Gammaproteobacteria bacterium]
MCEAEGENRQKSTESNECYAMKITKDVSRSLYWKGSYQIDHYWTVRFLIRGVVKLKEDKNLHTMLLAYYC